MTPNSSYAVLSGSRASTLTKESVGIHPPNAMTAPRPVSETAVRTVRRGSDDDVRNRLRRALGATKSTSLQTDSGVYQLWHVADSAGSKRWGRIP
jgi:hypothetical protein